MAELPTGTVTFLFTDLEGSTRLWEEIPDVMHEALARHDDLLARAIETHHGAIVKMTGDGVHAVFLTARDGIEAAVELQRALANEDWDSSGPLRVRIGIHTGEAEARHGDYFGSAVNRAARLMAAAHGGQVIVSQVTADLVRDELPSGVDLRDLGEHRLRDLSRPEQVFQVTAAGLALDFPPLHSDDARRGNLPLQLSSFVGREEELAAVATALHESRLVTLTGVGGVGKTRLAQQVAAGMEPEFAHGAWICELATASDADAMVQVIATAIGATQRPGMSLSASIAEFGRPKHMLVVLDNCEHVIEASGRLTKEVLDACPEVRVLATSREPLGVDGEQIWPLRSLLASDAERLFVTRAASVTPGFAVEPSNRGAVREICRRLDGIPLAIELAAARTASMRPHEIAAHLDERFRLLTGGPRTAVERHQTLRATVEWSYSLLTSTEQTVFDRLGVFVGSFDNAAATAVAVGDGIEPWDVLDAMASLVAKSMVTASAGPDDATRYELLETMRAYARERLDATSDADVWRRRHAEHYAVSAEELGPGLLSPDEFRWRDRFRSELDNLRAAVDWSLASPEEADHAFAIRVVTAFGVASMRDAGDWAERTRHVAQLTTPEARSAVLGSAAAHAQFRMDAEDARILGQRAVAEGAVGDGGGFITATMALAFAVGLSEGPEPALELLVPAHEALGDVRLADVGHRLFCTFESMWSLYGGDLARARSASTRAVEMARRMRIPSELALCLTQYGRTNRSEDPVGALAALEESIGLGRQGAVFFLDVALAAAATLLVADDAARALAYLHEALELARDQGNPMEITMAFDDTQVTMLELGQPEVAATLQGFLQLFEPPDWEEPRPEFQHFVVELREQLGEGGYEAALAQGAATTLDDLLAYLMAEVDRLQAEHTDG